MGERLETGGFNIAVAARIFDHVLRNGESYYHKWEYVGENPVRAGLVSRAEDWPYLGEFVVIDLA